MTELPQHLIIVGGGAIGTEMAQAFCRLGARVTLVTDMPRLLPRDDPEAAEVIQAILHEEGVRMCFGKRAEKASGTIGNMTVTLEDGTEVHGSHVLVAIGKTVDVRNLNPDAAGLQHENGRLLVDNHLRTSQSHIFAAGDVAGEPMLTHASSSEATVALINAISPIPMKRKPHMPRATFTDPEVAQAGLTEAQVKAQGIAYQVTRFPITRADRAMTDGKRDGFVKLVHAPKGRLYGATIVGPNAGEMMNEWAHIIERKGKVMDAATPIHIYPTLGVSNALIATEQLRHAVHNSRLGKVIKRVVGWLI